MHTQLVRLPSGKHYAAVERSSDGRVHLGKRFLEELLWHHDWELQAASLSPAVYGFSESSLATLAPALLISALALWILVTLSEPKDVWLHQLMLFLEAYVQLLAVATGWIYVYGQHWLRYINYFTHTSSELFLVFYGLLLLACCSLELVLFSLYEPRQLLPERMFCVLSAGLSTLWLCFLPQQLSVAGLLWLLFFASALCIAASILTMHAWWRWRWSRSLMLVATLFFYGFLVFGTLLPGAAALQLHDSRFLSILLYLSAFVVFPSEVLFGKIVLYLYRHSKQDQ
jgi:hypothetical protein